MRVRLDNIDHVLARPGDFDDSSLPKVPVIRIFGLSSTGLRACLHVHQVFPYFYINYYGSLNPDTVRAYIHKLIKSLNHATAISLRRDPTNEKSQYIRAIVLVKGVPFYGFHAAYQPYLKVLVADPTYVSRIVTILQSGSVMATRFMTYETHLSYYLQFMCDFGLYGCGWVELDEVFQRGKDNSSPSPEVAEVQSLPQSTHFRTSHLPLELDVCSHQILNRLSLEPRDIHTTLRIPAPPSPSDPLVHSVRELWEDERKRRLANGLNPTPDMPKILSESRRGKGEDWVDLERLQGLVEERCEKEREEGKVYKEKSKRWERWVMSTFESVEALWERRWRRWRPAEEGLKDDQVVDWRIEGQSGGLVGVADLEVNEKILSSQEMQFMGEEERLNGQEEEEEESDEEVQGIDPEAEDGPPLELQAKEQAEEHKLNEPDVFSGSDKTFSFPRTSQNASQAMVNGDTKHASLLDSNSPSHRRNMSTTSTVTAPASPPKQVSELGSFLTTNSSYETVSKRPTPDEEVCLDGHPPKKRRRLSNAKVEYAHSGHSPNDYVSSPTNLKYLDLSLTPTPPASLSTTSYTYFIPPPSSASLLASLEFYSLPAKEYRDPFYSNSDDLPDRPREYAGLLFDLTRGTGVDSLHEWEDVCGLGMENAAEPRNREEDKEIKEGPEGLCGWEYASASPSTRTVREWLMKQEKEDKGKNVVQRDGGGRPVRKMHIEGQTQKNIYGFKATLAPPAESWREKQNMTVLALEVLAETLTGKVPHPDEDALIAIFYSYQSGESLDSESGTLESTNMSYKTGIIIIESEHFDRRMMPHIGEISIVSSELDLINTTIDMVLALDPDILAGWEVQAASWGYLEARGKSFGFDVADSVGRAPIRHSGGNSYEWGLRHTSTFKVVGRHTLNVWRLMRAELALTMYSFENVAFNLLHRRVPKYTATTLTKWFSSSIPYQTVQVMRYYSSRTHMLLEMLDKAEIITKTAEFARVFGIDFFSVISRGSQFKVESFMFRIAKPESFILVSPTKADVGKQNAAECMPLIMEPYSAFYKGPLVVLDFQSLYPSVMIAYNYCYSTCLGRVQNFKGKNKLGVLTHLDNPPGLLSAVKDYITISPNGMIFVKSEVRRGLLGRMLTELLDTRVMVKHAMKAARGDKALMRVLDARQLGLKYIANVTYGYTSATFSGRMPAVEIADAIVQSGRETLEKAIELIDANKKWGARVVYGDTDSLFIYLQGRTKDQAFLIGNEIADTITAMNPAPIKLKFEKVYLPCVLMAKKRYVGFKYERPDDLEPAFDAKGIETVRRDGIPAQQKMVERCLKILFRTQDLSAIKEYCQTSWKQILEGSLSVQDFIFAKEVKLGTYSDKVAPPPGAALAGRRVLEDPNNEPQYGERIPYVITRGEPGTKLVDRVASPEEVVYNSNKHIDAQYYISRVLIPPLERIFNLVGADVKSWYNQMIKSASADNSETLAASPSKDKPIDEDTESQDVVEEEQTAIDSHYRSNCCILCGSTTDEEKRIAVCDSCTRKPEESLHALLGRLREAEQRLKKAHTICVSCTLSPMAEKVKCESLDCAWFYVRKQTERDLEAIKGVHGLTEEIERLSFERSKYSDTLGTHRTQPRSFSPADGVITS